MDYLSPMAATGKSLVILGSILILMGTLVWLLGSRFESRGGLFAGDISIQRPGFSFHFPLVTCLVMSLALTLIARIFHR
jgi:hypothetical protein